MSWGQFKPLVTEVVIEHLKPIQQRYKEIIAETEGSYFATVLKEGQEAASEVAEKTLRMVKEDMGFHIPQV